ncbi:aldo/keto reductase [Hydrogenophaga sp. UC242_50]|uniref:aldo/keto reductase n=1 Tax=Hydrogenophaga sp. UC242_50 TaxID=3350169 RepID=UPI0036D29465
MFPPPFRGNRRQWLGAALGAPLAAAWPAWPAWAANPAAPGLLTRRIPASGEALPVVGLGSWITFNVGNDPQARDACAEVVRAFFEAGGRLIDSSPMYGSSQPTIGHALAKLRHPAALFSAEKVWVGDAARGHAQMEASRAFWACRASTSCRCTTCWAGKATCRACSR